MSTGKFRNIANIAPCYSITFYYSSESFHLFYPRSSYTTLQVVLPQLLGELFDGVAEHGAGHGVIARVQKLLLRLTVAVAHLPQHPADSLVDKVVGVVQQQIGDVEGVLELAGPDKGKGGHNSNALVPEVLRPGQLIEERALLRLGQHPGPQDIVGAGIHQVPVVYVVHLLEVQPAELTAPLLAAAL